MKGKKYHRSISTPIRIGLSVLVATIGLAVTLTIVLAQVANFEASYKSGPLYAKPGDVITYTIVAVNSGGPVQNVLLSDILPDDVELVPGSCAYVASNNPGVNWSCGPLTDLWDENFATGDRITTTFLVTVTVPEGSVRWPLINHAYLNWGTNQQDLVFTTTVMDPIPEFTLSYDPPPPNVDTGQIMTYTILAINAGDSVSGVVLSDTLPTGVGFIPGSCTYDIELPAPQTGSVDVPCNDLIPGQTGLVWQEDMPHGTRITTTFLVTVTVPEGSGRWPLQNCAYLHWDIFQTQTCYTALANPTVRVYLPLIMRKWVWWYRLDNYEPNNKPSQAYGPLISQQLYQAYMWDATDRNDYYHFTPSTTTNVQVELTNIPVNCDYDLYVYDDPAGDYVVRSAHYGNVPESVNFTPIAGQQYFIRIYQYNSFSSSQLYHLVVTYE